MLIVSGKNTNQKMPSKYEGTKAQREYYRLRQRAVTKRWRDAGCCINCGLPCAPFWRCKKHRLNVSKLNQNYYKKHATYIKWTKKDKRAKARPPRIYVRKNE